MTDMPTDQIAVAIAERDRILLTLTVDQARALLDADDDGVSVRASPRGGVMKTTDEQLVEWAGRTGLLSTVTALTLAVRETLADALPPGCEIERVEGETTSDDPPSLRITVQFTIPQRTTEGD